MADKDTRSQIKRHSILEAATLAFRDEGYENASMDRIAELAGASKRTVYNHFGNKEALFLAVVQNLFDQMSAAKRIEWDEQTPIETQLARFAHAKSAIAEDPTFLSLLRVVLAVFIRDPQLAKQAVAGHDNDTLISWLEKACQAGALQIDDIPLAAKLFWSMAAGALFWPQIFEGPLPKTQKEKLTEALVGAFIAHYRP
jgi:TetR/AcrR family transcriptional regulator of autoinduction and epiphytic fitness